MITKIMHKQKFQISLEQTHNTYSDNEHIII